jgi:hypothetical protein
MGGVKDLEHAIAVLREMCIERQRVIDGEWGMGNMTYEELGNEIDDELFVRLNTKLIQ